LGQGMQQGMQGFQQAQQAQQQQQMFELKKAEMSRQANAPISMAPGGVLLDPVTKQPIFTAPMKPSGPTIVPAGSTALGPDGKPIFTAPQKPAAPSNLTQLIQERDALPADDPRRTTYDAAIKKATTSSPLVDMGTQETAFDREVGKTLGEQYSGLMRADMNAPAVIGKYRQLGNLLGQINTGKFKGTTTDIKAAAKAVGIDLQALGVTDDVGPAQAARSLSNQLALELRNPSGGAGMPGALSDQDRTFLLQMVAGLENDPAAWPKMLEYRVKLAEREQQVAKMARAYRKKHGKYDEGFYDELQEWSDKNPLFPAAPKSQPTTAPAAEGPKQGEVVDGYEFLGGDPANQASWRKK
jgi:hypothetical protein